jgi:hypothetical protein
MDLDVADMLDRDSVEDSFANERMAEAADIGRVLRGVEVALAVGSTAPQHGRKALAGARKIS